MIRIIKSPLVLILIFVFLTNIRSSAQVRDLGGVDYSFISGNGDDPNFSRARVWINIPIKLKKEGYYIVNGFRYANAKINFNSPVGFSTSDLEEFHALEYTLGYTYPINEKWRFTAQFNPTISSNLVNDLSFNDVILSGGIILIRTLNEKKKTRLSVGLTYSQTIGIPAPIPFINYWREVNDHLTYTLGFPISKAKYFFGDKKNSLEAFVRLDGYFANLSNDLVLPDGSNAEKLSLSQVITGIGFDKYYGKRANLFVKAGYTLRNSLRLNENTSDEVFDFNLSNAFFFRAGFKFNL